MGFIANVLTVLIASPGDVAEERDIATQELHLWNAANSSARQVMLAPLRWETHSSPQMGAHPQAVLNEQILDFADVVVGIFGTRIGTATPDYISGSVEEIKKHVAAGKLAMIYFSRVPIDPNLLNPDQWGALQRFKEECRTGGLYHEFETRDQFRQDFGHHLAIELNKPKYAWLARPQAAGQDTAEKPVLTDIERELLVGMSADPEGRVMYYETVAGFSVSTNGLNLADGTPRRTAALKRALKKLSEMGYTSSTSPEVYEITDEGFARADEEAAQRPTVPAEPVVSTKAAELLKAAADGRGMIMHRAFIGGEGLNAGSKDFMTGNHREDSEWREALQELTNKQLAEKKNNTLYELTAEGYRVADQLNQQS